MLDTTTITETKRKVRSSDGTNIAIRLWRPVGDSLGTIVIVPGFNAHSGRYRWVAEQFISDRLSTYAVDLRGRGESDGERFHVDKFGDYVSDVSAAIALARSDNPGIPMFLMGHSAGGVVSCFAALEHQHDLNGLICESFSFELPAPAIALAALKGISHILPHAHVVRLKSEDFSRNPDVVQSMKHDPLIAGEVETAETIAEMTRASEQLVQLFEDLTVPLLIVHGTDDKVAKPSGSRHFYEAAGSIDKTMNMYEGHVHDLLNDYDKEVVMADIRRWIALHLVDRVQQTSLDQSLV